MNYDLFNEAEVVMAVPTLERHHLDFNGVSNGVRVLFAPGHTRYHASLVVSTERMQSHQRSDRGGSIAGIGEGTVFIAGDAIVTPT